MSVATKWKHGGVTYPLTESTENSLLRDADPALYFAIDFFTHVLNTYVGPRLIAEAHPLGLRFPSAVEKTLHYEPTPFLLSDRLVFPLFCLYRSEEAWVEHTVAHDRSTSVWEWAYVLAPMTPTQIDKLHPILRSVAAVISAFAQQSFDPEYEDGATLRDLTGIMKMSAGPVRYGHFEEATGEVGRWWRALTGRLVVQERNHIVPEAFEKFEGVNADIDLAAENEQPVEAFVEVDTHKAPTLEAMAPESGPKAGNTHFELTGTGFVPGTSPRVLIAGSYASGVVVTHPTKLVGFTPPYDGQSGYRADVQVINADGQESNALEGAFTYV